MTVAHLPSQYLPHRLAGVGTVLYEPVSQSTVVRDQTDHCLLETVHWVFPVAEVSQGRPLRLSG
jgi:hypothetical protein